MNGQDSEKSEEKKSYDLLQPWKTLDPWQIDYINSKGNCFLLCGRQSGKSAAMAIKIAECAIEEKEGGDYLVIAFTEKQAYALFYKVLRYLEQKYPNMIAYGEDKPTQHEINIKKGRGKDYLAINCHAAGLSGDGLRHYTLKKLFIDEAAPMSYKVWTAVEPMISITKGTVDMSSTPRGKTGFFYDCSKRDDFTKFYVSAEDCPRHDPKFLELKRKDMTKLAYAQEYLAQFLDEIRQFFPDELIKSCMTLPRFSDSSTSNITNQTLFPSGVPPFQLSDNYCGVDVGGMGEDDSVIFSASRISRKKLKQIDMEITNKTRTTDTADRIKIADKKWHYKKIYIDSGGIGTGVFDNLLYDSQTRRKVVSINNASKDVEFDGIKKDRLIKIDLYMNLQGLMERGELELFQDDEIFLSLKSVQAEYEDGKLKIFGNYTHIAEALIRAAWIMQDKSLKCFIY